MVNVVYLLLLKEGDQGEDNINMFQQELDRTSTSTKLSVGNLINQ
jgi:hypothetical protein